MNEGAFRCWVLVKRDEIDGSIYAGCETYVGVSGLAVSLLFETLLMQGPVSDATA